jgi:hypothetical protein
MMLLLHNFESGAGAVAQPAWKSAREHCGAKANFMGLFDLTRCAYVLAKVVAIPVFGAGGNEDAHARAVIEKWQTESLKLFRSLEPSYCAIAVRFEPHAVRCNLHIPREQVSGLCRLYQMTVEIFMQAAGVPAAEPPKREPRPTVPEQ